MTQTAFVTAAFTANGTQQGVVTVANNSGFAIGATVYLQSTTLTTPKTLVIVNILGSTQVQLRDPTSKSYFSYFNCSAYTTAGGATITQPVQENNYYNNSATTIPLTTKGDLLGFSTAPGRLGIGTDGQVLTADSSNPFGFSWITGSGSGSGVTTFATIGSTPTAAGASVLGGTATLQPANGSFGGVVTTIAQTFAGIKTFSSPPVLSGASITAASIPSSAMANAAVASLTGTNSGDVTAAAFGSTPSATGLSLATQALSLQPFDATHPGAVVASGGGSTNFLRADGTWAAPAGTAYTAGAGLTLTGSSFAITAPIPLALGGTGSTSQNFVDLSTTQTVLGVKTFSSPPVMAGTSITANTTPYAALANAAAHTYLGNNTGSTAAVAGITATQLTADLNAFTSSLQGMTPASGGGTTNFLRADGTWAAPAGGGGASPLTTKGDLYTFDTANQRLGVGANNAVLMADSTQATGIKWQALAASATTDTTNATNITSGSLVNARLATMVTGTFKGNISGSTGVPADVTVTQVTANLNLFTSTLQGLVPGSGGGTTSFLRADGSWATPGGGGNVSGPGTATVGHVALFANTSGTLLSDSGLTLAGTNTGDVTVGVFGSTPNANGFSIASQVLSIQPFDATHPGAVTASGGGTTTFLRADGTWAAPLPSIGAHTYLGNNTSGTAVAGAITTTQLTADLNQFNATLQGVVPASGGGTTAFLRADGSWAAAGLTALTGDVTASGTGSQAATIAASAVTNAKMANMAAGTLKGNSTGAPAAPSDLTLTQVTAALNQFTTTLQGLVPGSGGGTVNYLRADGTWQTPPGTGGGSVTGPGTTVSGHVVLWNNTTGTLLSDSGLTLSGSNSGDITLGAFGSTPSATGASLAAQVLTLQPFDGTHPGLVTASGGGTSNYLRADGTWAAPSGGTGNTYTANQFGVVTSGSSTVMNVIAPDASTAKVLVSGGASANPAWALLTNTNLSGSAGITNANLATMAAATVKGNITGSTAAPTDVSAVTAPTASTISFRDASANIAYNAMALGVTSTATAAGTTTLVVGSTQIQIFTGTTTQTVVLPDATTLRVGQTYKISNRSTGAVQVNANGGGAIVTVAASSDREVRVLTIGTSAGTWDTSAAAAGGGSSPTTTKGDLAGFDTASNRVPVGADGLALIADSTQTLGVKYAPPGRNPFLVREIYEDFLNNVYSATAIGNLGWTNYNGGTGAAGAIVTTPPVSGSINHVGYISLSTGTTATGYFGIVNSNGTGAWRFSSSSGQVIFQTAILIPVLSNGTDRFVASAGFDSASSQAISGAGGFGVFYSDAGSIPNIPVTANGNLTAYYDDNTATSGFIDLGVTVVANTWYDIKVVLGRGGTRLDWYVDNVLKASKTTAIVAPAGAGIWPTVKIFKSAGTTARLMVCDYVYIRYENV